MKKLFLFVLISFFSFNLVNPFTTTAQTRQATDKQEFYKAEVLSITEEGKKTIGKTENIFQKVKVRINEGPDAGKEMLLEHGGVFTITDAQKVTAGDTVVLSKTTTADKKTSFAITDSYRLNTLLLIILGFFLLVIITSGKKGLGSILGMLISLAVIVFFIVPQIINGAHPLFVSIIGSIVIMVTTMYLAHGFSRQTHIAIAATFLSLFITASLAIIFVEFIQLSGLGSEDMYALLQGFQGKINFQGLLLGGIIIGALGVLDDITTTQVATLFQLADANPTLTVKDLFTRGMKVGREHITSLVNTLVLAYAGASIGIFIFLHLSIQTNVQPLWVILNSEVIVEEVIRTLAGSIGLILAVPITTIIAAFFSKHELKIN